MIRFILIFSLLWKFNPVTAQFNFIPSPDYIRISSSALTLYEEKDYGRSARTYDSLFRGGKGKGNRFDKYNAACAWALAGNRNKAFLYLQESLITTEWVNLANVLADTDLVSLHSDKRWDALIRQVTTNNVIPEARMNKPLMALLDTVIRNDQTDRYQMDAVQQQYGWQSRQMDSLIKKIDRQDSVNLVIVKNIMDTHGWLGPDQIGYSGNSALFLVIQHADSLTQVNYLPLMREAVKKGSARAQDLALLEDRVLVRQGKEQIYGSQLKTGPDGRNQFYPIRDEKKVNVRRAKMGLGPLEDYARLFGLEYVIPK